MAPSFSQRLRCESWHISIHGTVDFQWVGVGPEAKGTKCHWRPERYYWKVGQICPVDFQRVGVGPKAESTKFHWRPERFLLEGRSDLPMPVN